jgi:DNA-binding CsgD family transcriptional regulator
MELAFAGVHQLCVPLLDSLERLPLPQRRALGTAFGLMAGEPPDGLLVGLGLLSLLAEAAEQQPLLCLVDDAQWLDQASLQALAFVARRMLAEPVALVFGARTTDADPVLAGLPELQVSPLGDADARAVLLAALQSPLDVPVRDRIVAESRGNPLALLELPRTVPAGRLAGGFGQSDPQPLTTRIEQDFARRLAALPADTRTLLLTAAAEPTGDVTLLLRAIGLLEVPADAVVPGETEGLIELGARVRFRHPLVRSAVYASATPEQRRKVHRALAEATDPTVDPDRRAWHRARATLGADEEVAAELEGSALRVQARGGLAASAAFLEKAALLTPNPTNRSRRALDGAEAKFLAGVPDDASALLDSLETGQLDQLQRARVDLLHAKIAFASSRRREAPSLLLAAASRLRGLDEILERDTYLDSLAAGLFVGRLAGDVGVSDAAAAALASGGLSDDPPDLLLRGLALVISAGYTTGAPALKQAVRAFRTPDLPAADALHWLWLATHAAHDAWDDESWDVLCTRHVKLARENGALAGLSFALSARIGLLLFAGDLRMAAAVLDEVTAITQATGTQLAPYGAVALAAWQGRVAVAIPLVEAAKTLAIQRGDGMGLTLTQHAEAMLYLGLGRYQDALAAAEQGAAYPQELAFSSWSAVQLVEAAVRSGNRRLAMEALQKLEQTTRACGTEWALGVEARSRALVSEGDAAEESYLEAIDRLSRTRLSMELARARLLYGEWLRRERRRVDARKHLRTSHEMFSEMGAEAFAERARRELRATGETARKRTVDASNDLTPQEEQIARLAVEGRTNPDIGAELFISARTVEYHLSKVFLKLGISSRGQLHAALARP